MVELSAQLLTGGGEERTVRVRWRAREALKVSLFQDRNLIGDTFLPSDEYTGQIAQTAQFKVVADYGTGEVGEAAETVVVYSSGGSGSSNGGEGSGGYDPGGLTLLDKPTEVELEGSPNKVFNDLADWLNDRQVAAIADLQLSVADVTDYRKMGTTLPLLVRYQFEIQQFVTLQTGQQFVRLEYQGDVRGFQSFFSTINGMLNSPDTQASLSLTVSFKLEHPISPDGPELKGLQQALTRNPVDMDESTSQGCLLRQEDRDGDGRTRRRGDGGMRGWGDGETRRRGGWGDAEIGGQGDLGNGEYSVFLRS